VFGRTEIDAAIRFLLLALKRYGIVEQVRTGDVPGYQINPDALRWVGGNGEERPMDRTRLLDAGEIPPQVNDYFVECYRRFVDLKAILEAREHTAQVTSDDRREREERFRTADLPLLFCSPTMELGVDIAQLNVVNLRNVPPTPANYERRRAGYISYAREANILSSTTVPESSSVQTVSSPPISLARSRMPR
jgi:hypothetical protein